VVCALSNSCGWWVSWLSNAPSELIAVSARWALEPWFFSSLLSAFLHHWSGFSGMVTWNAVMELIALMSWIAIIIWLAATNIIVWWVSWFWSWNANSKFIALFSLGAVGAEIFWSTELEIVSLWNFHSFEDGLEWVGSSSKADNYEWCNSKGNLSHLFLINIIILLRIQLII